MSRAIIQWISDDEYVGHDVFNLLQKEYPQLNRFSKLEVVDRFTVWKAMHLPTSNMQRPQLPVPYKLSGKTRIHLAGWIRYFRDMDDIRWRLEYQKQLWRGIFYLPIPLFWRTIGRLARKPHWYQKGMGFRLSESSPIAPDPIQKREILLQPFRYRDYSSVRFEYEREIAVGYDAPTDTLLVHESRY